MSMKDKFLAWLDSQPASSGEQPPATNQPPPIPANVPNIPQTIAPPPPPTGPSPASSAEQEENKRLKAEISKLRQEKIEQAAEGFVKSMITSRTILPAEEAAFKAAYIQAATDDDANPMTDGSRVKILEASLANRPKHNMTIELVKTQLPAGAQALDNNQDPEAAAIEADKQAAIAYAKSANGKAKAS